jgi:hypothetical protein
MRLRKLFFRGSVSVMSQLDPMLEDIRQRAKAARIPIGTIMRRANKRPATWSDWQNGMSPKLETVRAVQAALEAELADRAA